MGIDPHMHTHTAVAVDRGTGEVLGELTVPARTKGFERLLTWARDLDTQRTFAIEDCRHVSGSLERFLLPRGECTVRVPPKLMAGVRRSAREPGKSDPIDARAVALASLREPNLPEARLAGPERDVALLISHREDLVAERTRIQSRLRWLLHDLDPALAPPLRTLDRMVHLQRLEDRLEALEQTIAVCICRELVVRCTELTRSAKALERQITELVKIQAPALLAFPGCGALTAGKILAETAGASRFRSEAAFAMHAGVAPIPVSSGKTDRYRLNRTGNRQLNAALHRIAVTQMRMHPLAIAFMERKRSEGKSTMEALRCLKRHLAKSIYRLLTEDQMIVSTEVGGLTAAAA